PSRSPLSALPVRFEENVGQTDSRARFLAHVGNGVVFLTGSETVLKVARADDSVASVRMQLVGASASAAAIGLDPLPGVSNYFVGSDPAQWRTGVRGYGRVRFE